MALNPPPASRGIAHPEASAAAAPQPALHPAPQPALQPEQHLRSGPPEDQLPLELCTDGVRRCVWESRWGAMLIEVAGDAVYVNGQRVER